MEINPDITVDFMGMTNDMRLWVRAVDVRAGFEPAVGRHATVGDDGADPAVARIVAIDAEGNLELVHTTSNVIPAQRPLSGNPGRASLVSRRLDLQPIL